MSPVIQVERIHCLNESNCENAFPVVTTAKSLDYHFEYRNIFSSNSVSWVDLSCFKVSQTAKVNHVPTIALASEQKKLGLG